MNGYRQTAIEAIDGVLKRFDIRDLSEIPKMDSDVRRLLKKDLENACPFERRGLPFHIYQTQVKVVLGIETRKDEPNSKPARELQISLF